MNFPLAEVAQPIVQILIALNALDLLWVVDNIISLRPAWAADVKPLGLIHVHILVGSGSSLLTVTFRSDCRGTCLCTFSRLRIHVHPSSALCIPVLLEVHRSSIQV